jgi:hypothetical protein
LIRSATAFICATYGLSAPKSVVNVISRMSHSACCPAGVVYDSWSNSNSSCRTRAGLAFGLRLRA